MKLSVAEFPARFARALGEANERPTHKIEAKNDQVELRLQEKSDVTSEEAIEQLYLSQSRSHLMIDAAVHPKRDGWFFVRPSGHQPALRSETTNAETIGPFKVLIPA